MWRFTEVADWFEGKRAQSDKILDQWVESSNYSQMVMITAASTKALTTFGAGFVDVLRLGDGIKEGSLSGVGTDALRFIAIFPVGKVASLMKSAKGVASAKLVVDIGGPNCFWVASAKALAQIGHKYRGKLFASVEDLAKALGMNMTALWQIPSLAAGVAHLQKLGAKVGAVKAIAATKDIEKMVPFNGSVVMIAVRVMKGGKVVAGHAVYAFRNTIGQVRYMDRTVGGLTPKVYKTLSDIAPAYSATALVPYQAAVIHNMFVKSVVHDVPRLVMPILGVIASERAQ